jgi:hypothetical protein
VTTGALIYSNDSVGNITSTPLAGVTLTAGHSYRWNMVASNSAGTSNVTPLFYFQEQSAYAFYQGELVMVTGGSGANLHSCANLAPTCPTLVLMPYGQVMTVASGTPVAASGNTWWELSGYVNGTYSTGWAAQSLLAAD